jgi:magnesium transporter
VKAALFHVQNHHVSQVEGEEAVAQVLAGNKLRNFWLDLEDPGEEGVRWLDEHFHFHPLALEDLQLPNYRPKLTAYDGHLFLIAHAVSSQGNDIAIQEVHSFLTRDCLVTVHDGPCAPVARAQRVLAADPRDLTRGADHVLYLLLDEIADSYFAVVDAVDDVLDTLESEVLRRVEIGLLDRVFDLRRDLATLRRLATYQRDALSALVDHEGTYVHRSNVLYLHDVQNLMVTVHEMIDNQRDLTNGVLEVYLSATSNRLNEIVKRLTLVATIFLPISFVAGLFGTNFQFMPFDNPAWFALMVASLIATPVAMLVWFWRSGWL